MSTENKERYLQKIKKLLNLARRSTNANEAANAMNQAQALMRQHGITATDVDLLEINEEGSKSAPSHAQKMPKYMANLAEVICRAFGVQCYHQYYSIDRRQVVFYGPNERPTIAAYAFDVLSRQMVKARRERADCGRTLKPAPKPDVPINYARVGLLASIRLSMTLPLPIRSKH